MAPTASTLDRPRPTRPSPVPCPREFDTMRMMAERLADKCDHFRVDFLVSDGRVYVGGDEQIWRLHASTRGAGLIIVTATAHEARYSFSFALAGSD